MKACSAPGPDGLPVIFFQRFWETVRPAIMPMFQEFYIGTLDIGRLNFSVITRIPKVVGASNIRQFRPTTVINVVARIFAKVCATCLSPVAERIAYPLQSAFLKGRRIHDGILALHEIVHELGLFGSVSDEVLLWLSPLWKAPLPSKIKIFVWELLRDRLPSGTEVLKRHGPGNDTCPLCHVPDNGTHILFSCVAAQALWGFVPEALGPEWEAHDLADFLQVRATQAGRKRRLFWLIFATPSWTLWTTRNKTVIERVFQRHACDSFFKFLAFLQHWHPLAMPRDRLRLQGYLDALLMSSRRLSPRPHDA
ncbi:Signal recognition particle 54 kDa protein, chloroplastic [Hordeum vulgare]|nr:Signal recognition particle 54 kDa protein, chloroplastic [Hordeum vulgare]